MSKIERSDVVAAFAAHPDVADLDVATRAKMMAALELALGDTQPAASNAPANKSSNGGEPLVVYTDGACSGNPGPGGWAAVFADGTEITGGAAQTTNNQMEMAAAIAALEATAPAAHVRVHTDSQLIVGIMSQGWKAKANLDLVDQLRRLAGERRVEWIKVKGHDGVRLNERADELAVATRDRHAG